MFSKIRKPNIESEFAVESTTANLMRLYEYWLNGINDQENKQFDMETQLSFLGIRFKENNIDEFQQYLNGFIKNEKTMIFKLSFRLLCAFLEGIKPDMSSFEFFKIKILKNKMLKFEHKVEPSKIVTEEIKDKGRNNLIEQFKRYYWDAKAMYEENNKKRQEKFDQSLLLTSYDAQKPYNQLMSGKVRSPGNVSKFDSDEIIDEEDLDDDDFDEF